MKGSVAAVYRGSSITDMVARGSNSAFYHRYRNSSGTWSSWTVDGASGLGGAGPTDPAISTLGGTYLHVWVAGTDYTLWMKRWSGSSWTWYGGYQPSSSVHIATGTSPSVAPHSSTEVDVVLRGDDGNIWYGLWNDSTLSFSSWSFTAGAPSAGLSGSPAVADGNSTVTVFTADANGHIQSNARTGSSWGGWTLAPSLAGNETTASNPQASAYGLGALYRGTTPTAPIDVAYSDSSEVVEYRSWYSSTPSAAVALTTGGDRVLVGSYSGGTTGCDTLSKFENTAILVPSGAAGCTSGARVVYMPGEPIDSTQETLVWSSPLSCLLGTGGTGTCGSLTECPASTSFNLYNSGTHPGIPTSGIPWISGGPPSGGGFSSNDNLIVRVPSGPTNGNSLLLSRQFVLKDNPSCDSPDAGQVQRGGEMFFRSTDCGATWDYVTHLDPCTTGVENCTGCDPAGGGMDRPEMTVDPVTGTVYFVVRTIGGTSHNLTTLFKSIDAGSTWSIAQSTGGTKVQIPASPHVYPAMVDERLFLLASNAKLYFFDGSNFVQVYSASGVAEVVSSSLITSPWGPPGSSAHLSLSPVGHFGSSYYVRVLYGARSGSIFIGKVDLVKVTGSTFENVGSATITGGASSSMLALTSVAQDRISPSPVNSNVELIQWYETSQTDTSGGNNYGTARTRGCVLRDLDTTCTIVNLSVDPTSGNYRTWTWSNVVNDPIHTDHMGHYFHGSGIYDASTQKISFLSHWAEQQGTGGTRRELHANIVSVDP